MKKIVLMMGILLLVIGCGNNSNLKEEVNGIVNNNSYAIIYDNLNKLVNEIKMFPNKDSEEEFIYYVLAIKDNYAKFSNDELVNINNLLDFNYSFTFNKIDYSKNDYDADRQVLAGYIK